MSNWYPRYYGDYMRDTSHLSLAEHGAYTVLLDHYYATGKALPNDEMVIARICRSICHDDAKAVSSVLNQFFPVNGDGLRHNKRADEEIAKEKAISAARSEAGKIGAHGKWHGKQMAIATTSTSTSTEEHPQPPPEKEKICTDPAQPPARVPPHKRVSFDMESGRIGGYDDADLAVLKEAYPACDIRREISAAGAWLLANPAKRKKNVWGFVTRWCARSQERGGGIGYVQKPGVPADYSDRDDPLTGKAVRR